jgi:hypothetical protein
MRSTAGGRAVQREVEVGGQPVSQPVKPVNRSPANRSANRSRSNRVSHRSA